MTESQKKILEMLAQNKINIGDAQRLLNAISDEEGGKNNAGHENTGHETGKEWKQSVKTSPKYLRVTVTPGENADDHGDMFRDGKVGRVNVRVPMSLIRAGIKLTALIPPEALDKANSALKEKGINFDVRNIKPEDLEELIQALGDMQIDIEGGHGEKVKVFVE
ncbi:MAG: hypothetical protein ABR958_05715 [Dehalococcoidales bacterium]